MPPRYVLTCGGTKLSSQSTLDSTFPRSHIAQNLYISIEVLLMLLHKQIASRKGKFHVSPHKREVEPSSVSNASQWSFLVQGKVIKNYDHICQGIKD